MSWTKLGFHKRAGLRISVQLFLRTALASYPVVLSRLMSRKRYAKASARITGL